MKEIKLAKAAALTSPDPLVLICTQKEALFAWKGYAKVAPAAEKEQ